MGLGVRERENYSQGHPRLNLIDCRLAVTSPTKTVPNHRNRPQAPRFCLQPEEADEISDKLGPGLRKVFKHFVWVLNYLSAKFL